MAARLRRVATFQRGSRARCSERAGSTVRIALRDQPIALIPLATAQFDDTLSPQAPRGGLAKLDDRDRARGAQTAEVEVAQAGPAEVDVARTGPAAFVVAGARRAAARAPAEPRLTFKFDLDGVCPGDIHAIANFGGERLLEDRSQRSAIEQARAGRFHN